MSNKIIAIFFGLLSVVIANYTESTSSSKESLEEKMLIKSYIDRMKIVGFAIKEGSVAYNEILEKVPKAFTEVLKDPKVTEVTNEIMERNIEVLKNYTDRIIKLKEDDFHTHALEVFQGFNNIAKHFFTKKQDNLSLEAAIIEKSLRLNGFEDLLKSIQKHYENFFDKSSSELDEYINGLNDDEREFEKKLIEWYEKFKAVQDIEMKIELCESFPKRDFAKSLLHGRNDNE